jgi:pyruvate dehydrogenase E2 component (dihydrolipoamide acetyltransferase)
MSDMPQLLASLAAWPQIDFSEFGETETRPLPKLQQLTASFLGRNWVAIPHVTHHDEADITDLEARRGAWNRANPDRKLTIVPILGKLLAEALTAYPQFNASIAADGRSLVLKHYVNVGFAIDSPRGLLVGVVRDCDRKHASEIAAELSALSAKAKEKGLSLPEMSGGCITLSSLGHIGGTSFTPIVNAPEVAILGVTRAQVRAAPDATGGVAWRKMLPLSLSYDHRVINGADAARFVRFLADRLGAEDLLA